MSAPLERQALGGHCVFASEVDVDCQEVYAANFGPQHLFGDITMVEPETLPLHDLLTAGFPCQPFTRLSTLQGGRDAMFNDWWYFVKICN